MPTVSVLMSTYNGEKYLQEQIDSILHQEGVSVRLQVRDDGSSDRTLIILEQYRQEGKLTYIKGENIGYGKSFMWLVKHAEEAEYFAFSDQDDVWDKKKLVNAIHELEKHISEPALCVTNYQMVDESLHIIPNNQNSIPIDISKYTSNQMKKAVAVENIVAGYGCTQVWNERLQMLAIQAKCEMNIPHDYILGMLAIYTGRFLFCDERLVMYRQHGNNSSGSRVGYKKALRILKRNIHTLTGHQEQQISKIDNNFYTGYQELIDIPGTTILKNVINYNSSLLSRTVLLISDYCKGFPFHMWIKTKLKIILGRL